ncbi:MAG TPA: arylamine N-acetyltransferase [bacterium]|nr:arylamine N-acetyltransferase [bacterium]
MSQPTTPAVIAHEAYFHRIGYTGNRAPTLATLRGIQARHSQTIAFENLDPLLGRPVRLDPASLQQKLIHDRRGGYCFEQNLLLSGVLKALGFCVAPLAARVLWNRPDDAITGRTHMLLRVDIEGQHYLADVGFGGQTPTGPLRLEMDLEQATPHESFRIAKAGDGFKMQSKVGEAWRTLYRFDLQEELQPDYEIANHYTSTHPSSLFVNSLRAARPAEDRRFALLNNELAVHHLHGPTERRVLKSVAEMRQTLEGPFRLKLPDVPELDRVLERFLDT